MVWKDPWLPREWNSQVRSFYKVGLEELKVCDLINEDQLSSNTDMIRGIFTEEEVELILNIPLSIQHKEDKCIWVPTSNGKYTLKFAYTHLREGYSHKTDRAPILWKYVWQVVIPPKVKNFIWRMLTNTFSDKA